MEKFKIYCSVYGREGKVTPLITPVVGVRHLNVLAGLRHNISNQN